MKSSGKSIPIGGEFWFDLKLFNKEPQTLDNSIKLSGGQCSINYILEDINPSVDEVILLPAYLCPSILHWFGKKDIKFAFYKIKKDLSIDLDDLELCLTKYKTKAVFFINYFGFYNSDEVLNFLRQLKQKGIILIEDAVQMFWTKSNDRFIGTYVFNSLRKFLPVDGSFLICGKEKDYRIGEMDSYSKLSYKARMLKTLYQHFGVGDEKEFLECFELADEAYYKRETIEPLDKKSEDLIKKIDVNFIGSRRIANYEYLYNKLINAGIKPMFNHESGSETIPLGLPILISNRDTVRRELRKREIYCPVHWDVRKEDWVTGFEDSYYVSDRILTLPIDQRYEFEDMDRLFNELIACLS